MVYPVNQNPKTGIRFVFMYYIKRMRWVQSVHNGTCRQFSGYSIYYRYGAWSRDYVSNIPAISKTIQDENTIAKIRCRNEME